MVARMTETKTKILDAASALFLEGGAAALSVRAISKRAGLSTIGIYSHFNGKQGILDALYIEGFDYVSDTVKDLDAPGDQQLAIVTATERYLDMADQHRAHYKLIFGEGDSSYTPSDEAKLAGRSAFSLLVKRAASLLPDQADQKKQQEFALSIWALIHGFVSLQYHAVSNLLEGKDWRAMIIEAVERHIDAYVKDCQK